MLCAPPTGNQPEGDEATLLASSTGLCPCLLLRVFYSFLLLKDQERQRREGQRDSRGGVTGGVGV